MFSFSLFFENVVTVRSFKCQHHEFNQPDNLKIKMFSLCCLYAYQLSPVTVKILALQLGACFVDMWNRIECNLLFTSMQELFNPGRKKKIVSKLRRHDWHPIQISTLFRSFLFLSKTRRWQYGDVSCEVFLCLLCCSVFPCVMFLCFHPLRFLEPTQEY